MNLHLKGIIIENKTNYKVVDNINFPLFFEEKFDDNLDSVLFVNFLNLYHLEFEIFPKIDEFISLVNTINKNKKLNKIIFILNEVCINNYDEFELIKKQTNLEYKILNYDLYSNKRNHIFYSSALYSHLKYLIDNDFLSAKHFLINMNKEFHNLRKPYKGTFYSRHINPIRIDIFNILKQENSLDEMMWSFFKIEEYYSRDRHDLDKFYQDNKGLIPYSFDSSSEEMIFKHTYFSQFLGYFEIFTESYFIRDIENKNYYCPMTEKILKTIFSLLPFIVFGPKELKNGLEELGLTFNSPLYGFYDISDDSDIKKGLEHVQKQIKLPKEELHKIYFEYLDEYNNNFNLFLTFLRNNLLELKKEILN
jgi:glycerophosphoryl diester phosphodiesterase